MTYEDFAPYFSEVEMTDQWVAIVKSNEVLKAAKGLKKLGFTHLLDLCVVDYLTYGVSEWDTKGSTQGFSRAQVQKMDNPNWDGPRFVVVCHLLNMEKRSRFRLKVYLEDDLKMSTLSNIWPSAIWYEREAYDLFGITFRRHPDMRRILTDYGFEGHPFRKDFPLIGTVEMRYDGEMESCIYEPVSIEERTGVPKVVRDDNRYVE